MCRSSFLCALVTSLVFAAACGNDHGFDATVEASGLPCEIQSFLADQCQGCHGSPPSGGAPMRLLTHSDLAAKNASGVSVAERCLDRMTGSGAQMPPLPVAAVNPADVTLFADWVNAGAPSGTCADGGSGPFGGPLVCTSGKTWTGGNRESPLMHPGVPCISCHARGEGPRFAIAGTVYPTGHEPDDCNGATSATVEVTDAAGKVVSLAVNAAGNFSSRTAVAFPIQVAVVANGQRRAMVASPMTGDCNTCHTQDGANGAPGRIARP